MCSPFIHPLAFVGDAIRKVDSEQIWVANQYLITIPKDQTGFNDSYAPKCQTPYLLQNNPNHKHYGCLAFVECGLLVPKYIHGDYDLYALVPADKPWKKESRRGNLSTSMNPSSLTIQQQRVLHTPVPNVYGPLQFRVMNWLDRAIGYPMVMHGEQENIGHKDDEVIVFLPSNTDYKRFIFLSGENEIRSFYAQVLEGRQI